MFTVYLLDANRGYVAETRCGDKDLLWQAVIDLTLDVSEGATLSFG